MMEVDGVARKRNDVEPAGTPTGALVPAVLDRVDLVQLSLFEVAPWHDDQRALPNDFARAALFTTRNKKVPRVPYQKHLIYHVNKDVVILYTGIELRADDDELIWQQVLDYAKRQPMGSPVSFSLYELCKDVGWSINGRYYARAEECLARLQATAIAFESKRVGRVESLSLVRRFRIVGKGTKQPRCQVELDPEMIVLFDNQHYSKFVWERYRRLSPTARRLFDYLASHAQPFPVRLETFRQICGSESARPKKWREQVGDAAREVMDAGLIKRAWIDGDVIRCER